MTMTMAARWEFDLETYGMNLSSSLMDYIFIVEVDAAHQLKKLRQSIVENSTRTSTEKIHTFLMDRHLISDGTYTNLAVAT